MKLTLLQMVTSIMSDMDSDAITSINDTPESLQVASIIKDTYFQYISNIEVPELEQMFQLLTVDNSHPNYLQIPTTIQNFDYIKYDKIRAGDTNKAIVEVKYCIPKDFVDLTIVRQSSDSGVIFTPDPNTGVNLLIRNDTPPSYWTTFDDNYICFDSYDVAVDTTGLQGSKSFCWGQSIPTWTVADGFIPTLDDNLFAMLLSEAKSTCFATIKQAPNAKLEKQARNQKVNTANDRARSKQAQRASSNGEYAGPNFGRRTPYLRATRDSHNT